MKISLKNPVIVFTSFILLVYIVHAGCFQDRIAFAGNNQNLEISNQYIKIFVNRSDDATGRFAVDSTGGDPLDPRDDNMPLIYGRPKPWTSYTTFRIDGVDYVFGGNTQTRAGRYARYGTKISEPEITPDNKIISTWRFGDIEVTQTLTIVRSTTTGLFDTAKITYVVTNLGITRHQVGVRMILDTLLGSNDGAPFRAHDKAITSDTVFLGSEIPRFFQAFDSVSNPSVTSQGTLIGADATPPDKVVFTNWGNLADRVWDVLVVPGRRFLREGEYELDSALALFWNERDFEPGESREYSTLYGMGGMSVAPGVLALGVTSPAEVTSEKGKPVSFPIIAYIENNGPTVALDVYVELKLPHGLSLVSGDKDRISLGNLEPGETRQTAWEITSDITEEVTLRYEVVAEAENAEKNRAYREVTILSPAKLNISISAPSIFGVADDMFHPYPLKIGATINNSGGAPAYGVQVTLTPDYGILLAPNERGSRFPGQIVPGEAYDIAWYLVPLGYEGMFDYTVRADARNTETLTATTAIGVPELKSRLIPEIPVSPIKCGEFFIIRILGRNLKGFRQLMFNLSYDPSILEAIYVSRGTAFVEDTGMSRWNEGVIDNHVGLLTNVYGCLTQTMDITGELATIGFRAKAVGESHILLKDISVSGKAGEIAISSIKEGSVIVTGK